MRNTSKSCSITRAASVVILFSSDSPKAPTASLHKRGRTRSSIRATLAFEREAFVGSSDGTESKAVVLILPPRPANPLPAHKRHRRRGARADRQSCDAELSYLPHLRNLQGPVRLEPCASPTP